MAIQGAPDITFQFGGTYSTGPAAGVYHVIVNEAALGTAQKTSRPYIGLDLFGKDDPNNSAKNGKRVTKQRVYSAMESDDDDKQKTMRGMTKRTLCDGYGLKWPADGKSLDPRQLVGKTAWVLIGPKKNEETGEIRNEVIAVAQDKEKLPKVNTAPVAGLPNGAPSNGTRARR